MDTAADDREREADLTATDWLRHGPETLPISGDEAGPRPDEGGAEGIRLGQLIGGRYQIIDLLARGGMSRLYCARDRWTTDQIVAVKEFNARGLAQADSWSLVAAFMREANILTSLKHPHIVRAIRFIEDAGSYYIVMEWLGGQNLNHELESTPGGLPEVRVLKWAEQLCAALHYLHTRRPPVIFCDLKPSNVFLLEDGQVKLVDFGIARYYYPDAANDTLQFGTPGFAAPELYRSGQISPATDIYGLGRTLHCLLTGYDARGDLPAATTFDYPPARALRPELSPTTEAVLVKAMQVDPAQRYASAEAMAQALRAG